MILTLERDKKNGVYQKPVTRQVSKWGRVSLSTPGGHRLEIEAVKKNDGTYVLSVVEMDIGCETKELAKFTFDK